MDLLSIALKLAAVILLIFMNGFFVAAEFAIVKIRKSRLDMLVQEGNKRAGYARKLTEHLDASLSVTQLGITLASLGLGWIGEPAIAELIIPVTSSLGIGEAAAHTLALALGFAVITAGHIILGELTPKSMAIQHVEGVALGVALPMLIFHRLMYPFVWLLNHVANWVVRKLGFDASAEENAAHSEEEIRILMKESHKHGYIDKTEFDFVDNVFDFSDLDVREIMVPRTDMICLYLEDDIEKSMQTALNSPQTRYPICREDKDHVIGFLHTKDLLATLYRGQKPDLEKLARQVLVVPETMAVSKLLKIMQHKRAQLAIVVDEYGGTAGLLTFEDIIEEIVGDVQDEFDQERPEVERRGAGIYSVDARLLVEEINEILEINLETDNVDTIGGWLYERVAIPPRVGQMSSYDGNEFFIEEMENVRITRVLVKLRREVQEEHEEIKDAVSVWGN